MRPSAVLTKVSLPTWLLPAVALFAFGCAKDPSPQDIAESGEGDGDGTGTGDGDGDEGDGDGDAGDGDGDGDEGDGDGDAGDGDGDGDGCCQASQGEFPDCVPPGSGTAVTSVVGPLDGLCTVTAVESGPPAIIDLECRSGSATITIEVEPAWVPTLQVDDSVLARYEDNVGGAKGVGSTYRTYQLQHADTREVILAYGWGEYPAAIDAFLAPTEVEDICATVCQNGSQGSAQSAVQFSDGVNELTLFEGHGGQLGSYAIWLGVALDYVTCGVDEWAGRYEYFVAPAPP